jgi:hypothetical protein
MYFLNFIKYDCNSLDISNLIHTMKQNDVIFYNMKIILKHQKLFTSSSIFDESVLLFKIHRISFPLWYIFQDIDRNAKVWSHCSIATS